MKYSNELTAEICKYLRAGNNQRDSAILSGISEETFYTWIKTKPEFSEPIKKAEQECKARNIAFIQKAAEKSWQAAAWYLERKYNNEFALKNINELQGKDGEPIKLTVIGGGGFVPGSFAFIAPPTGSTLQSASQVQGVSLASQSKKDNNSNNGTGQADAA